MARETNLIVLGSLFVVNELLEGPANERMKKVSGWTKDRKKKINDNCKIKNVMKMEVVGLSCSALFTVVSLWSTTAHGAQE